MSLPDDFFTHLTLWQTFERTVKILWNKCGLFSALTATFVLPAFFYAMTFVAVIFMDDPNITTTQASIIIAVNLLAAVPFLVVTVVVPAAMMRVVAEMYVGNSPGYCESIKKALKRFWPLLCYNILIAIIDIALMAVGWNVAAAEKNVPKVLWILVSAVCATLCLYFIVSMTSAPPLIVVERTSVLEGMKRSWELASGRRGYIAAAVFLLCLTSMVSSIILWVVHLVFIPIYAILVVVIYLNLRVDKEGLNHDVLLRDLDIESQEHLPIPTVENYAEGYNAYSDEKSEVPVVAVDTAVV